MTSYLRAASLTKCVARSTRYGEWLCQWLSRIGCWADHRVVSAGIVLDPAEVPLHPHADGVVGVWQLETGSIVVVEGFQASRHSCVVLQASIGSCEKYFLITIWKPFQTTTFSQRITFNLCDLDGECSGERLTSSDHCENNRIVARETHVHIHYWQQGLQ